MADDRLTTCTSKERELLDTLKEAGAYRAAPGPYSGSPAKHDHIKRMRLFTQRERRQMLDADLFVDEIEMINFDTGSGLWPGES
jgi:hypothetical protein